LPEKQISTWYNITRRKEGSLLNREEAVNGAVSSVEMEGFVFTDDQKYFLSKLAKGEISHDDVFIFIQDGIKKLRKERPEIFTKEQ
jgi:hypothetical protein